MAGVTFQDWSKQKMSEWKLTQTYYSPKGIVTSTVDGEWIGKVMVGEKLFRISEVFESAPVAIKAVERTYERERAKGK